MKGVRDRERERGRWEREREGRREGGRKGERERERERGREGESGRVERREGGEILESILVHTHVPIVTK